MSKDFLKFLRKHNHRWWWSWCCLTVIITAASNWVPAMCPQILLKHSHQILWHPFQWEVGSTCTPLESGLCESLINRIWWGWPRPCQFLGPGLEKLAASTSYVLGHLLSEPRHHAVGKPSSHMERSLAGDLTKSSSWGPSRQSHHPSCLTSEWARTSDSFCLHCESLPASSHPAWYWKG